METKIDKKGYERPQFTVIELAQESTILQASTGASAEDLDLQYFDEL